MKFIKLFEEQTAFDEAKSTLNRPNVSLIKTNRNVYSLTEEGGVNANGHSYVDLGLPSLLKWATMNVGATSETDYGDYFMWGSTTPNTASECTWTNAPFNNGTNDYDSNYFNAHKSEWLDNNNNLKPEYDAASQIMGGDWRMPTKAEIQELIDYTTNEWFTNYNGTGVNGRKFTSKTNGNSIFIPASGYRFGSSFGSQGDHGNVWSSSLDTSTPNYAWNLNIDSVSADAINNLRDNGFTVRGVL